MPKGFEIEDLCLYERIVELCGSPRHDLIACTVQRVDRENNTYQSTIWCYPAQGGAPVQMTSGESPDNSPNWSPDGQQLAFVSPDDKGTPQIFLVARGGGERRQLTHLPGSAVSLAWSPAGDRLLVTATLTVDPVSLSGPATQVANGGPEIVWRLPYKSDGLGYVLNQQVHLFVVDAATGAATQLTHGAFDVRAMAWSPDGKSIAYARTRDERCAHRTDIWSMQADGSDVRQLTNEVAMASFPKWSPDGNIIAFSGSAEEGDAQLRLWTFDRRDGKVRRVGEDDIDVVDGGSLIWDDDSQGICLIAGRRSLQEVGHIDVPDGAYRTIARGMWHVSALAVTSGQRLASAAESPLEPNQVHVCGRGAGDGGHGGREDKPHGKGNGGDATQISSLNGWWYERSQGRLSLRRFEVPDGAGGTERAEGWVFCPGHTDRPGPLLVDIHGGPASHALLAYTSHPYWNVLVSRGWTILALNAVGSSGYGREFAERLRGRWGALTLQQHLAAADQLHKTGEADGRMAICGKSFGGYVAAWAVTTTTRFRAAVISAPMTNLETHLGTSDSGYFADPHDMRALPFEEPERYGEPSPARYANKVRTPILVLQGKDDQRCPLPQAEDFFVKVMRFTAAPAEMVLYPGGDHHFYEQGQPSHRVDVMSRTVNWLERWIDQPVDGSD